MSDVLSKVLGDLLQKENVAISRAKDRVATARAGVQEAILYVQGAQARCARATAEDDLAKKELQALKVHYNSLPVDERPSAIRDGINDLQTQQTQTFEKLQEAKRLLDQAEENLRIAKVDEALANREQLRAEQRYQELVTGKLGS